MKLFSLKKIILFLLICLISAAGIAAQYQVDENSPEWLKMEKGRNAVRDRELGVALQIFRKISTEAEKKGRHVPEAEMWLGYIFEQEGELELAEQQYLRAMDHSSSLYIPEDRFTILYRLAGIYSNSFQYGKYEQTLKNVVALGSGTSEKPDPAALAFQESMYNVLLRNGVDKLFTLYRKDERNLQQAYSDLGLYYYRTGLYGEAVRNCISALVTPVTNVVAYRRQKDFIYEYSTLENFIRDSFQDKYLAGYLKETLFTRNLYYLGASLHAGGYSPLARGIWQALVNAAESDPWRDRAARQLTRPFIEPLLTPQNWD